ncbi:hypothetical protein J3458_019053 [Metarhizium acridum]|uniref:uncharacterized protein n=1 Tax=Metarhizium acridum TaxID=92637 RepID=UPI001C6B8C79|nr:hypothetical protein J3458_019053 [Metarhizium acridum]
MPQQQQASILPSAEMPMPGGAMQYRLLRALDDNMSLYELSLELAKIGREFPKDPVLIANHVRIGPTALALWTDSGRKWEMFMLLLSMHRSTIRAIILGTVAYEACHGRLETYPNPAFNEDHAQGVYVVGLRRIGAGGKFLTVNELRRLITGLERYIEGCRVLWNVTTPSQRTARQSELAQWVAMVDGMYSTASKSLRPIALAYPTEARFIEGPPDTRSVQAFITSLRKGCRPMQALPSTRTLANYRKTQHFSSVNRSLGLTVSVLAALGFHVDLSVHVVLRTWKASQLRTAEQLVVTLAGSLVHQTGFNSIPGGDNAGSDAGMAQAEDLVLGCPNGPLQDNIISCRADREQRLRFEATLERLDSGIARINAVTRECDSIIERLQPYMSIPAADLERSIEADIEALDQKLDQVRLAESWAEALLRAYKYAAPELCQSIDDEMEDID